MKLLIAGGGTGGHVFPGLALADAFRKLDADAQVVFLGAERGLEKRIVPAHGYTLFTLPVRGVMGTGLFKGLFRLMGLLVAALRAISILGKIKPDLVVGVGGYASVPAVLAASIRGIPRCILEQNVMPGRANRVLARFAQRIYQGFASRHELFPREKTVVSGNPIRAGALSPESMDKNHFDTFNLLIVGGSQGARQLNKLAMELVPLLLDRNPSLRVIHQTGSLNEEMVTGGYADMEDKIEIVPFIENMGDVYSRTDLCLSRSGAMAVSELAAAGIPAVLVPFPESAGGHQVSNAHWLQERGGAVMIDPDHADAESVSDALERIITDRELCQDMAEASRKAGVRNAAEMIARQELERIGWRTGD